MSIRTAKLPAVALAGVLALALLAVSAPTAFAGKSQSIQTNGGYVSFHHVGNRIHANDTRSEGWSVVAQIRLKNGAVPISELTDGDGANGNPNRNRLRGVAEGRDIELRMCYQDRLDTGAPIIKGCSGWQDAEV